VANLVDTNVLVYSFDPRDPIKQRRADEILQTGLLDDSVVLAHQSIVEFVSAVSRPRRDLGGAPLLAPEEARLEAEQFVADYEVLYPTRDVVLTALRGAAMYGLSWFDAHLWAYAEVYGVAEILSEDFAHGRHYGSVRAVNPFLTVDGVHDLPPLHDVAPRAVARAGGRAARSRRTSAARGA
jgi:predicted nucleic acid-binding protein